MIQHIDNEQVGYQFPCHYAVKAMGLNTSNFQARVISLVELHTGPIQSSQVNTKPSRSERYLSVTVNIQAHSRAQLDAIYQGLTDDEHVLMRL